MTGALTRSQGFEVEFSTPYVISGAVVVNDQSNRFANPGFGISAFGGGEYKFKEVGSYFQS